MSDDIDVERLSSKEEYDEKPSQVIEKIEHTNTQKRGRSCTGSRRLVYATFINIWITPKGLEGIPNLANSPNFQKEV